MKQHIRNKIKIILEEKGVIHYSLFYSSLLDQLYVLYIVLAGAAFMLFAHLSILPVLILLCYMIIAYLFGAYRNHSFAIGNNCMWIINGRKPFVSIEKIDLANIKKIIIASNAHPILDRIFIIPSNIYIQIIENNNKEKNIWYTNIDFAQDAKEGEKNLEDLVSEIKAFGIQIECIASRDEDAL